MENLELVREMYESGMSIYDIGSKLGRSHQYAFRRIKALGLKTRSSPSNPQHKQWRGGRTMHDGYVRVLVSTDDPMAPMRNNNGYVLEHRLVMARALERPLRDSETVHHINGDRADNRLENLQLRIGPHGKHAAYRCADCGSHNIIPAALGESPKEKTS